MGVLEWDDVLGVLVVSTCVELKAIEIVLLTITSVVLNHLLGQWVAWLATYGPKDNLAKWNDQTWQLGGHFSMVVLFWLMIDTTIHPFDVPDDTIVWAYLMLQLGLWMATLVRCVREHPRRKDHREMLVHHVVTILLVSYGIGRGHGRIGALVVYLHDVSDVVLDLAKLSNYLKYEGPAYWYCTELLFGTVLLFAWPFYRLWWLPKYVQDVAVHLPDEPDTLSMLILLVGLHVWWWKAMWRVALSMLTAPISDAADKTKYT